MNTGYVNLIPVAMHFLDWLDEDERQNLLIDLQDNLPIDVTIDQRGGQTSLEFWTKNVNVFKHWSVTNCIRARFVQYVQAMGQTNIVTFVGNRTVVNCVDGCLSTDWGGDVSGGGGHLSALKMGLKLAAPKEIRLNSVVAIEIPAGVADTKHAAYEKVATGAAWSEVMLPAVDGPELDLHHARHR